MQPAGKMTSAKLLKTWWQGRNRTADASLFRAVFNHPYLLILQLPKPALDSFSRLLFGTIMNQAVKSAAEVCLAILRLRCGVRCKAITQNSFMEKTQMVVTKRVAGVVKHNDGDFSVVQNGRNRRARKGPPPHMAFSSTTTDE